MEPDEVVAIATDVYERRGGSSKPIMRRVKNKIVGRTLGRAGVWSRLWR